MTHFSSRLLFSFNLWVVQDHRERVLQAGLEEQREGSDITVHLHEVALVLPHWFDR